MRRRAPINNCVQNAILEQSELRYKKLLELQSLSAEPFSPATIAILTWLIRALRAQEKFAEADEISLHQQNVLYFLESNK